MTTLTRTTLLVLLGALCTAGTAACSSEDPTGPLAPSPPSAMADSPPTAEVYNKPAGTPSDPAWQELLQDAEIRNASNTTRTNWLSATPSRVTLDRVIETPTDTVTPGAEVTVRFTRSGHTPLLIPRGPVRRTGPWMGEYWPNGHGSYLSLNHSSSTDPAVFTTTDPRGREGCNNAGNRSASMITICRFTVPENACELSEWPGYPQFTRALCRPVKVILYTAIDGGTSNFRGFRHMACVQTEATITKDGVEYSARSVGNCG